MLMLTQGTFSLAGAHRKRVGVRGGRYREGRALHQRGSGAASQSHRGVCAREEDHHVGRLFLGVQLYYKFPIDFEPKSVPFV